MKESEDEEELLRSVALQNAQSILRARQRVENELLLSNSALKRKTEELDHSLSLIQATLDATNDAVLAIAGDGRVSDFNQKFLELWQLAAGDVEGKPYEAVLPLIAKQVRAPDLLAASTDMHAPVEDEVEEWSLAGDRTVERMTRSRTVAGADVGRVWCFRDVTSLRRAQAQRLQLLEREQAARTDAEAANRAKDEFLAIVSHELRTPLNAITGWANMLLSGSLTPDKQRHGVEVIARNATAQAKLIDDLLDVSRIISGKVRLSVDVVDPMDFVQMAIESIRPAAHAKDIQLRITLDPDAGTLMGDRDRLQQVVWNLLANAIKFTPKGGTVQVRMRRLNSSVELEVEDNGIGMKPEFMPYLFERFRQADSSFTRSKGGLGLGLAIVRHLVELHGGTIKARSEGEQQGACFTLRLPVAPMRSSRDSSQPPVDASLTLRSDPMNCAELAGMHILIVDDDPDGLDMLADLLASCNAVVTVAHSAAEAYQLLQSTKPDVLVSDIGMPGEDGYDLIRKVRKLSRAEGGATPAVALTAYARAQDRTQALRLGFDMHVAKPIDASELAVVLSNLGRRRAHEH